MNNPIDPMGFRIPDEIYEAALAYVASGKKQLKGMQRFAAMAGYCAGAMNERDGYHKTQSNM